MSMKVQRILLFIAMFCLIISIKGMAQEKDEVFEVGNTPIESEPIDFGEGDKTKKPVDDNLIYAAVELSPEFPGGSQEMYKFIRATMKYPRRAKKDHVEGTVFVGFVIQKDGSFSDVKVYRGVSPELDKEAHRIVSSMPKWKPGKQENKVVKVKYVLPIKFKLEESR